MLGVLLAAMVAGSVHDIGETVRAKLDYTDSPLFTVTARPPDGHELQHSGSQALTFEQAASLRERLAGMADMAMFLYPQGSVGVSMTLPSGETVTTTPQVSYLPVDARYFNLMRLSLDTGRFFTDQEVDSGQDICVLGASRVEKTNRHSNPQGRVENSYAIAGRLHPAEGLPYPVRLSESSDVPAVDDLVFVPVTRPITLSLSSGRVEASPTAIIPLVRPHAGHTEEALELVQTVLREYWPGWALGVTLGGGLTVVLEKTEEQVTSYFQMVNAAVLLMVLVALSGFSTVLLARRRREMALERALGATRTETVLRGIAPCLLFGGAGLILGTAAVYLAGPFITEQTQVPLAITRDGFVMAAGGILAALVLSALVTGIAGTASRPGPALRQGAVVRGRRSFDVRLALMMVTVFLGALATTSLLLTTRASLTSLEGYLRSAGERTILVRQDVFAATHTLSRDDRLNPAHAELLREGLPEEWDLVFQQDALCTLVGGPQGKISVWAYGLDRLWPEGYGFAYKPGLHLSLEPPGAPACLIGERLAALLFGSDDPVGGVLEFAGGRTVEIAGVLQPRPRGVVDVPGDRDYSLVLPHRLLLEVADREPDFRTAQLLLYPPDEVDPQSLGLSVVSGALDDMGVSDIGLVPSTVMGDVSALSEVRRKAGRFQTFLVWGAFLSAAWIAAVVLQTRVAELRREIGLLRAAGASRTWVRTRVVGHTVILFLSAGLPGIIAGVILSLRISVDEYWSMTLAPGPVVQVLLGMVVLAVLAAWLPAANACGEHPITALREGDRA